MHSPSLLSRSLPSDFLPDFLKLDLAVGTASPNPMCQALDGILEDLFEIRGTEALCLFPDYAPIHQKRNWLTSLGLRVQSLPDSALQQLFAFRKPLFEKRMTLASINLLGQISFEQLFVEARRGRPETASRIENRHQTDLTVGSQNGLRSAITAYFRRFPQADRWTEFRHNAQWFAPQGFTFHKSLVEPAPSVERRLGLHQFTLKPIRLPAFQINLNKNQTEGT